MLTGKQLNELSEILAAALASRPDLMQRLSSLLESSQQRALPGKEKKTKEQRKEDIRKMLTELHYKSKLKKK